MPIGREPVRLRGGRFAGTVGGAAKFSVATTLTVPVAASIVKLPTQDGRKLRRRRHR